MDNQNQSDMKTQKLTKSRFLAISVIVAIVFFGLGFITNSLGPKLKISTPISSQTSDIDLAKFWKVNSVLREKFDGDISSEKQSEGAIAGMVASLGDPYTTYLTKQQNSELNSQLNGKLSGIGIEVGLKNNRLTVIAPIDGTPAQKAGLRAGDIIASVDGVDTSSMTVDEAVSKIRGSKGTQVKLTIVRPGSSPQEITITREDITVPSVSYEMKNNSVGYIKIRTFGADTDKAVENAASSLVAQGAKSLVIDVRDNPGGYLDSVVKISSNFIKSGTIVAEKSRNSQDKTFNASGSGKYTNIPIVVLINNGSASASEILAGALHDNGRAILVGEKTYGKGSVQEVVCLSGNALSSECDGDSLKVTVAHWYTPKGVNISKEGIAPDQEVKLTTEDYNSGKDPQLQKALEVAAQ